ncbi:MAG: D-alanyl-D-alanine carboxypeptidase family protein [Ruminococcus sp.]|nr:D-alanyl-D-alanine carboxypeptidase family protein [Ruminococcus sp.]
MKNRMMKKFLCTAAAALTAAMPVGTAHAADAVVGDMNGDGSVTISDSVIMRRYLHGVLDIDSDSFLAGDINNDGSVDSLDLAGLKYIIFSNSGRMPVGAWAILGTGEDYFYFDGDGNVTVTHTYNTTAGTVTENKVTVEGNKLIITGEDENREYTISWVNSKRFDMIENGRKRIPVVYYGSQPLVYDRLLNGTWISDSGREYDITGINGYYSELGAETTENFSYEKDLNKLIFHFDSENLNDGVNAYITAVDSMHIDLTWEDGTVERLTSRNYEVIDGVTYINGILIANKTYSLPSDYAPNGILPEAQAAFNEMQAAARRDGLSLEICSGYRSYAYQRDLYNSYVNRDGKAKADTYSARPGHSEHQTGLAMDINWAGDAFNNTPEAKWIAAHCAEYGFIIRYPQGKQDITGYKYESWHVRYLGKELAGEVTDSGLTLEEFLGIDSVYKY